MNQLPITPQTITHCLGIDPDLTKSGFAAWNRQKDQFDQVTTLTSWMLLTTILTHYPPTTAIIRIDAGWLIKKVWHGEPVAAHKWPMHSRLANAAETGRRVGVNNGVGMTMTEILRGHGYQVTEVKPGTTGWGEWDQQKARQLTGWKPVTNDEKRDAMRLSFKR